MIAAALGGGFWNVVMVIAVAFVPGFARVARASTLAVKQEPYVEAAVAVGLRTPKIILRHVLPNISAPIVVLMTLWVASAIRLEASLSFLGIGTQPPNPSWGNIIRDGLGNIFGSPWPIIGAGFAITVVVLAFNVFGDAVRDVLDPGDGLMAAPLLEVDDLAVEFGPKADAVRAVDGVSFEVAAGRLGRHRRRIRFRQVGDVAVDPAPYRRSRRAGSCEGGSCSRASTCSTCHARACRRSAAATSP